MAMPQRGTLAVLQNEEAPADAHAQHWTTLCRMSPTGGNVAEMVKQKGDKGDWKNV